MLHEDVERYNRLTNSEEGANAPVVRLAAYLDGYERCMNEVERLAEEGYSPSEILSRLKELWA
jgi:hypothetical protein